MAEQTLITVGALGLKYDNVIYYIIKEMFMNSNYKLLYSKKSISILTNGDDLVLIVKLTPQTIDYVYNLGLDIHIVVHKNIKMIDYKDSYIETVVSKAKYIIMNVDDKEARGILHNSIDGLIITYGINQKATLTASSFTFCKNSQFNLCLQRGYKGLKGDIIEPMELPVTLNLMGRSNMYYGLGAIACGLTCGIDLDTIGDALLGVRGTDRRLEKIHEGEFTIVDHRCKLPSDYNSALEEIQNLKYKDAYVINGIEIDGGVHTIKRNLDIILSWKPILNIKKIFFYIDKKEKLIINNIDLLLKNYTIQYEIFFDLNQCLSCPIKILKKDDLLLLLGDESLKEAKRMVKLLI